MSPGWVKGAVKLKGPLTMSGWRGQLARVGGVSRARETHSVHDPEPEDGG